MPTPCPRLAVHALEDRSLLTAFGIPWADPSHLTLSFVPDGTATPYGPSSLSGTMGQTVPGASWQREVLRAFQTWAAQANVTVSVVPDGGQPLGTVGAVQGDARFGDIRIAAAPIGNERLASAAPFSWSGTTLAGDVVFNSNYRFSTGSAADAYDVFSVALHEAGHVFGLDHSHEAGSSLCEAYEYRTGLTAADVTALRVLYGARTPDAFEGAYGNNTLSRAVALPRDALLYNRFTAVGDLTTLADADFYKFSVAPLMGILGVSVRLQGAGVSLLAPRVTVYNGSGQVLATTLSTDPLNNDLLLHFSPSALGGTYYVRVDKAASDVFGIGAYRLAVDYLSVGSVLTPLAPLLTPVLDGHTNDLLGLSTLLFATPKPTPDRRFDFIYRGVIEDGVDVDNYRFKAPTVRDAGPQTLNVMVWALQADGLDPRVAVYDAATRAPVAFQVLANEAGLMSVQIPNASTTAEYIVSVKARTPGTRATGSYFLAADFNTFAPTALAGVATSTVSPTRTDTAKLTVTEPAVYQFVLDARLFQPTAGQAGGVVMTVTDAAGRVVFTLAVDAGQPAVTTTRYLAAGSYTVKYAYRPVSGQATGTVQYNLFMLEVTEGVGPYATDSTRSGSASGPTTTTSGGYTYGGSSTTKPSGEYYYF